MEAVVYKHKQSHKTLGFCHHSRDYYIVDPEYIDKCPISQEDLCYVTSIKLTPKSQLTALKDAPAAWDNVRTKGWHKETVEVKI